MFVSASVQLTVVSSQQTRFETRRKKSIDKHSLRTQLHNPTTTPESLIQTPKIHGSDAVLPQRRSAHDARLDGDVEVRLVQDGERVLGDDLADGDEFGVAGALVKAVSCCSLLVMLVVL